MDVVGVLVLTPDTSNTILNSFIDDCTKSSMEQYNSNVFFPLINFPK